MAESNLIPLSRRSEQDRKRIASMGGKASQAARREKRLIADALRMILDSKLPEGEEKAMLEANGITEHTELMAMCAGMVRRARENPSAFREVIERVEGKTVDKAELTGAFEVNIRVVG